MLLKTRSVRVRLTLWYVAVLALIVCGFALGVYTFLRASLLQQIDNHLQRDLDTVARIVSQGGQELRWLARGGNVRLYRIEWGDDTAAETGAWSRAGLGKVVTGAGDAPFWAPDASPDQPYRIKASLAAFQGKTVAIAVAHDGVTYQASLRSLTITLLLTIPAALVLAIAGGYFLAGRALAPIGALTAKAREINAERLSERLPVDNPDDEFGQLAAVFNETLVRLEDSFERLRSFTADASHELRTPLTAIRSVGEVAMQEPIDAAASREVIGSMLEETGRLTKLVDSLLVLSRADAGTVPLTRERTDLAALAAEACDCLQVLAEEKEQTLTIAAPMPVPAEVDRPTVRQALINLLDNAIKYTPARGHIQVAVGVAQGGQATIAVSDDGPGIAPEHRQKIYERFYRVDKGRFREVGGAGLGLSIARWAVSANNGRIELDCPEGKGCTFRMVLPLLQG